MGSPKAVSQKTTTQPPPSRDDILLYLVENERLSRTLEHFGLTKTQLKDLLFSTPADSSRKPLPAPDKTTDAKKPFKALPSASLPLFEEPTPLAPSPALDTSPAKAAEVAPLAPPTKAEPPKAKAEPPKAKAESLKAEPPKAKAESLKAEPPKAKAESLKAEPPKAKAESLKAEPSSLIAKPATKKMATETDLPPSAPVKAGKRAESRVEHAPAPAEEVKAKSLAKDPPRPLETSAQDNPAKTRTEGKVAEKKASPSLVSKPEKSTPADKISADKPSIQSAKEESQELAPSKAKAAAKTAEKKAPLADAKKPGKTRKALAFEDEEENDEEEDEEIDEIEASSSDELEVPRKPSRRQSAPRGRRTFILEPEHTIYQRLLIYTDGAARGNPGESGAGVVLKTPEGEEVGRFGRYLGRKTNNHAEYEAVLLGLRHAREFGAVDVTILSDSELLVRQLLGEYRVRALHLRELFQEVKQMLGEFEKHQIKRIGREKNVEADSMSNRAIDEKL